MNGMRNHLADEDPASLADELTVQFEAARAALLTVGSIARQLHSAAQEAAASTVPRVVRVKAATRPRGTAGRVGRPPGQRNHLTLLATPAQIEELRAQLRK